MTGLFDQQEAELEVQDAIDDRLAEIERHRKSWACCWPEWEGPRVGGWCCVGSCVVFNITNDEISYHYCAPCRIIEISDDGETFVVEIEYQSDCHCAPIYNGQRLRLDVLEVWAPVCQLIAERERQEDGINDKTSGGLFQ